MSLLSDIVNCLADSTCIIATTASGILSQVVKPYKLIFSKWYHTGATRPYELTIRYSTKTFVVFATAHSHPEQNSESIPLPNISCIIVTSALNILSRRRLWRDIMWESILAEPRKLYLIKCLQRLRTIIEGAPLRSMAHRQLRVNPIPT
jgi:hypothetical protein